MRCWAPFLVFMARKGALFNVSIRRPLHVSSGSKSGVSAIAIHFDAHAAIPFEAMFVWRARSMRASAVRAKSGLSSMPSQSRP